MVIMLILAGFGNLWSQNITQIEYFFNTDPGFGAGTPIPVVTPSPDLNNINHTIAIWSLSDGFYKLFIRVKDENGRWSHAKERAFLKQTVNFSAVPITYAEYFFDTDPGMGNGTQIPIPVQSILIDTLSVGIDISGLNDGFHQLFVRVKDKNKRWSHTNKRSFLKETISAPNTQITAAEYFIDTDPGFGQGTPVPVTPGVSLITDVNVDITAVTPGFHNLFVRIKDNFGRWSLTTKRAFLNENIVLATSNVQRIEYFIDSDPGLGLGQAIPVTPGQNLNSVNHIIGLTGITPGFHKLFIRAQDDEGRWSHTQIRNFLKQNVETGDAKITKAEYFIDTDPGFGLATQVEITPDTNDAESSFLVDLTNLSNGFHKLFVRSCDDHGKWSHSKFQAFYKQLVEEDSLADLVYAEYFYDTDPGLGNGLSIAFNPVQNIPFLAFQLDLTGIEFGQHFLFVRTLDEDGLWSLTTRDTIFYYLDSLPTAVLNGPPGVCENGVAEFEVNLTGTAPWTLIINTGFETDTISGIMTTPYIFNVSPTGTGTKTAQVLKVQDVYYTGLYTGIPIEYEVYPLPLAASPILGSTHICRGSTYLHYQIYQVAYATDYEWSFPAGCEYSYYYSWGHYNVWVSFPQGAQSGMISVRGKNACGYGPSSSLYVEIHELPVVNAGPDLAIPYGDSAQLNAVVTGGEAPYSYYWAPWYYLDNYSISNPKAGPPSDITYTVYATDSYGCQGSDDVKIDVGPPPGSTINGTITYDNAIHSPMSNVTVYLKLGNTIVDQTYTNYYGNYSFGSVQPGSYTITATTQKAWGGANATDAMQVLKHFAQVSTLQGLHLLVADLNMDGAINSIDGLLIASRFVGNANSFVTGDWAFEAISLDVAPFSLYQADFMANCYGDVDGSYIPGAKTESGVEMICEGNLIPGDAVSTIPVRIMQNISTDAVSLIMNLSKGVVVNEIRMNTLSGNFSWTQKGTEVRLAWYDTETLHLSTGDILFAMDVETASAGNLRLEAQAGTEFAGTNAIALNGLKLSYPTLSSLLNRFELGANFPNPFSGLTSIPYSIPADGTISLEVYDALGQMVARPVNHHQKAGNYVFELDGNQLNSGIYQYTLIYNNGQDVLTLSKKMISNK